MWLWRDSPVVDLGDTAGVTAVVKVCYLNLEQDLCSAQDAMCQTRTWGFKEEEVSSFMALCSVTANAVLARWSVMDGEAVQYM